MTSNHRHPEQVEGMNAQDGWQNCQGGEIASCLQGLSMRRRAERRSAIFRSTITVAGLLVVVGLGSLWMLPPQNAVANISCKEVHNLGEQYVAHELDAELTARIEKHLGRCPRCKTHIDSLSDQLAYALSWLGEQFPGANPADRSSELLAVRYSGNST